MGTKSQGDWKRAAQECAEKLAAQTANRVWLAYWRKYRKLRRAKKR